jgi:hypothetical protein
MNQLQEPSNWVTGLEHTGEHVPDLGASLQWAQDWGLGLLPQPNQEGPSTLPRQEFQGDKGQGMLPFEPGHLAQHLSLSSVAMGQYTPEKTVYEIPMYNNTPTNPLLGSAGWQLQDMFATPAELPRPASSSDEQDDANLYEVTLRDNALRALRAAKLCQPATVDEVTSQVSSMEVSPKTSFMTKFFRKISPSVLGIPTTGGQRKRGGSKGEPVSVPARRGERPAAIANSMKINIKAQASACMRLGLIQCEAEFNEQVLQQYLALYNEPLPDNYVQELAALTEVSSRPEFVLPNSELIGMLQEVPHAE